MNIDYEENGYFVVKCLFQRDELMELKNILQEFHESWKKENFEFYSEKAVNSASLTGVKHFDDVKRQKLFSFIGSCKITNILYSVMPKGAAFMNTQLFFNPVNENQKNYWHRDSQYHLSIEEQQKALSGTRVLHFRIPLEVV